MDTSEAIELHTSQLRRFGFTVVPNVIPADEVDCVAANVLRAGEKIGAAARAFRESSGSVQADMREGWADLAKDAITARGFEPDSASTRSVEQHNHLLASVAEELREAHGLTDPYRSSVPTGHIDPGVNHIAYYPELSRYLADPRVLGIAKAVLDPHVRIAQLEINKTNHPSPPDRLQVRWLLARSVYVHAWTDGLERTWCRGRMGGRPGVATTATGRTTLPTLPVGMWHNHSRTSPWHCRQYGISWTLVQRMEALGSFPDQCENIPRYDLVTCAVLVASNRFLA
jgi:hypothetical protein